MKSLATIDEANNKKYLETLANLDPQLYLIRIGLDESGIDPQIVVSLLNALTKIRIGTGYGRITTYVQGSEVVSVKSEESVFVLKEKT